jgi:hypothetical protein
VVTGLVLDVKHVLRVVEVEREVAARIVEPTRDCAFYRALRRESFRIAWREEAARCARQQLNRVPRPPIQSRPHGRGLYTKDLKEAKGLFEELGE